MTTKARRTAGAPPQDQDELWPLMVRFILTQKAWWTGICAEFELTIMQGHALRILDPDRPLPMSALAEVLSCDASNVTGLIDKLESRGLIARQGAEHDRRIKMLAVTAKGRALRERLNARIMEPPAAVAALPPEARARLAEIMRAIVDERELPSAPPLRKQA